MTPLLSALLFFVPPAGAFDRSVDCPDGMERVETDNPYEPFKCQKTGERPGGLKAVSGPRGFKTRPRCPSGTRPIMTPDKLQPYRCVADAAKAAEPGLEILPAPAPSPAAAARPRLTANSFRRYTIPGELSFDYPKDWKLIDAWKDEVPALFIALDPAQGGRQVTMMISRLEPGQAGYQEMEEHILKEKEWHGAVEMPAGRVAGLPARLTRVERGSRSVYLALEAGRYYTLIFTAPAELDAAYEPAFSRLLKSLRILGGPGQP